MSWAGQKRRERQGTGTIHYRYTDSTSAVYGKPRGYPACGRAARLTLASDPDEVTCGQCKRSGLWRQALAEVA